MTDAKLQYLIGHIAIIAAMASSNWWLIAYGLVQFGFGFIEARRWLS